jgi:RNA polymerase sigma-70 factor, ECF subfamily
MINWFKKNVVQRLSEEQLISKIQHGDKEAFGKLYLIYLDRIYRYVFFKVNHDKHIAEDITEIIFIKAMQHINTFLPDQGTFQAWLYRIAHNTVLDHYKTYKTANRIQENTASVEAIEKLEEEIDTRQKLAAVMNAMRELTEEQQSVLSLRFIEGLNPREIAYITNKHEDAVRAIQYRALKTLKKKLQN